MAAREEPTSWAGSSGSARFDLRSDVVTTPTPAMLQAVQQCSMLDDVWQEDTSTTDLEEYCAKLTGMESGLLVLSGTMGNQLALSALLDVPPHSILCDSRSHIFNSEAGGVALLTSALVCPVSPRNGLYLTLEDITAAYSPSGNIIKAPTQVIALENTLHGVVMPLAELQKVSAFARSQGIRLHCDGARLWEAVSAGAGSLPEYAACFDTISLCFSKGLGAPIGSILVGNAKTIDRARRLRKAIGGGLRQAGVISSAAKVAVQDTFERMINEDGNLLRGTHRTAKEVERLWKSLGGTTKYPVQTNVVWLDLHAANISPALLSSIADGEELKLKGERLVIHYQVYQNEGVVLEKLERVFRNVWARRGEAGNGVDASSQSY